MTPHIRDDPTTHPHTYTQRDTNPAFPTPTHRQRELAIEDGRPGRHGGKRMYCRRSHLGCRVYGRSLALSITSFEFEVCGSPTLI